VRIVDDVVVPIVSVLAHVKVLRVKHTEAHVLKHGVVEQDGVLARVEVQNLVDVRRLQVAFKSKGEFIGTRPAGQLILAFAADDQIRSALAEEPVIASKPTDFIVVWRSVKNVVFAVLTIDVGHACHSSCPQCAADNQGGRISLELATLQRNRATLLEPPGRSAA
jgi:hypothetical protein